MVERVVQIRRVAKVVKGGGHLSFTALVVVGDGQGTVGVHIGKSRAVPDAVRKGTIGARKNMRKVTLAGTTIPHEIVSSFNGATVLLKPASPGTGMIAGGGVRAAVGGCGSARRALQDLRLQQHHQHRQSNGPGTRAPARPQGRNCPSARSPDSGLGGLIMGDLRITQVRSIIGHRTYQESNLRSLGLRKIGQQVVRADSPVVRGMIDKVKHLVEVEEIS